MTTTNESRGADWKTLIRRIDSRIIDPVSRYRPISLIYIVFACAMLMHHVYITIHFSSISFGPSIFRIPWIIFGVVSFFLGRMWKDKGFWFLAAWLLLKYLRVAIPDAAHLKKVYNVYQLCFYAFFGCYAIGRVLSEKDRKTFISLFCALWTAAVVVLFSLGLYTAWTGIEIKNLGSKAIRITDGDFRLATVYYPVECGVLASVSIAMALIAISLSRHKAVKTLYLLAIPVMVITGALTVTRMSNITNALVFSFAICYAFSRGKTGPAGLFKRMPKAARYAVAIAAFAVLSVGLIYVQQKIVPGFNALRTQKGLVIRSAMAETAAETGNAIADRPIEFGGGIDTFLNGRITIWKNVLAAMKEDRSLILWGQSTVNIIAPVNEIRIPNGLYKVYHAHNTLIQAFLENGIPGFLLYFSFLLYFLKNAFQLLWCKTAPTWQRFLPIPTLICWCVDMIDCTGYVNLGRPPMTILYVFAGLTIAVAADYRRQRKSRITEGDQAA